MAEHTATSEKSRIDGYRVAALAATLGLHIAALLFLLGERAVAPSTRSTTVVVRLIEPPDAAAGPSYDSPSPASTAKSPQQRTPTKTASAPRHAPVQRNAPIDAARTLVASRVPPLAIEPPRLGGDLSAPSFAPSDLAGSDSPSSAAASSGGSGASGTMRRIRFVHEAQPKFPRQYRDGRRDAYAIVAVRIDKRGAPHEVRMVRSSGAADFDFSVREAARSSRYTPHFHNGEPIDFWALIPYSSGNAEPDVDRVLADAGIEHN